jgi:hypothetical protein
MMSRQHLSARSRRSLLGFFLVSALLLAGALGLGVQAAAGGQISTPGFVVARSQSGQFSICTLPSAAPSARFSNLETNQNLARLEPTMLPTSCERIKQILWRKLGATAPWRGSVSLALVQTISGDDPVTITSTQFSDGWRYRVELPELVDRTRYVRAIVQVLLLEMANRTAVAHSAEIPAWLLEGLTQEILASSTKDELIPPPPRPTGDITRLPAAFTFVDARRQNPLEAAHQTLRLASPLSFQELSWPSPEHLGATVSEVYRDSAQLFVDQLLALKDGRACLRAMIEALPQHYNWQFAFLRAFHSYFQRPLDIEKWWALQTLQFTGRELTQTWPPAESWQKLDELIRSEVQIRFGTNTLPVHGQISLQTIVGEWDSSRQGQALQAKLHELGLLRPRVATELVPLLDEYRRVLASFLQNREGSGSVLPFRKKAAARHLTEETMRQLAELDRQRLALRPPSTKSESPDAKPGARTNDVGRAFANRFRGTP